MREFDVVIVGAGASGLSLAHRLALSRARDLSVALVEPPEGPLRPPERTWCFWERESGPWDPLLTARWDRLAVVAPDSRCKTAGIAPLSYKMLRSRDLESHVATGAARETARYRAAVSIVEDGERRAVVHATDTEGTPLTLAGGWVFDSRPPSPPPTARTTLLQHFRGWFVRTRDDAFDPRSPVLMDLRTPQPGVGVSFGYVLPLSFRSALVEYTEFTHDVLDDAGYNAALDDYTGRLLGLSEFTITASEQGVIPMTDAVFHTRAGRRVFRIGAAGGATRPSTGYTFSGIQRQAAAIVRALERGRTPVPPVPHRRRHRAMDAVLLRALDTGRVDGAVFFTRLFGRNAPRDVLGFLDGRSRLPTEVALGATTPLAPMAFTAAEQVWHTLGGRARRPALTR